MCTSVQVSPDGGLIQSSTLADTHEVKFADGVYRAVPGSYMEFAERQILPEFQHLQVRLFFDWRIGGSLRYRVDSGWAKFWPAIFKLLGRCKLRSGG
jgi:hypothetical protein